MSIVKCWGKASVNDYTSLYGFHANTALGKERILITHSADNLLDNTAEASCTVREDRCTSTTGGKNSIITSGRGFARRQQKCRAQEDPWLCIRKRNDVGERRTGEDDASRRRCRRTSRPTTMATTTTTTRTMTRTEQCSPGTRNSSSKCSLRASGGGMRTDKKLGNVLTPWIRGPARTTSYSELYRRRFS